MLDVDIIDASIHHYGSYITTIQDACMYNSAYYIYMHLV